MARFGWRDAMLCGLAWGLCVVLATGLAQPVADVSWAEAARFAFGLCLAWCPAGLVWAFGMKWAEAWRRPRLLVPATFLLSWAVSFALTSVPLPGGSPSRDDLGQLMQNTPGWDLAVYSLWINLFYGSLYAAGFLYTRRALRLRHSLAELRVVRREAEATLREARLSAVRGQMQPAMLLDALDALRRAYAQDLAAGERLFELLIAFLRAAMPGLRSGRSTLAAELAVVIRYAELRAALSPDPAPWRLDLGEPPPELAFPPLRLLPALDRVSRALPPDASVGVTAAAAADAFLLRVDVQSVRPLAAGALQGLRAGLRRDLGLRTAALPSAAAGSLLAEVRLPLPAAA